MNDWVDLDTLMEATRGLRGWSSRAIDRKAKERLIAWRPLREPGQTGRPRREYFIPSLPSEVQAKVRELQARGESQELACRPFNVPEENPAAPPQLVREAQSSEDRDRAEFRYSIISPTLDFSGPVNFDGRMIRTLTQMVEAVAKLGNVSPSRVWDWRRRYMGPNGGLPALLDKPQRSDKGQSRFFAAHEKAAAQAASLYLGQNKLSIAQIHRNLLANSTALEIPEDEFPSRETLRSFLNEKERQLQIGQFVITPAMRIMAREGLRGYENKVAPFVRRGYTDVFANQIWCSDHGIRDALVWNDCFYDFVPGAQLRLRLTGLADFRSRKIMGFSFAVEGSSLSIVTAMRGPLMRFGPPERLYVDNGEDCRKVGREICPLIGIDAQFCLPYHGQAKPIERFWRTLKEDFDVLFETYTGGKPELRPDASVVELARHKKLLAMDAPELSGLPPASYYVGLAVVWMNEFNHHHSHSGEGMDGRTPNEVFEAYPNPLQKPPLTPAQLIFTLAERRKRKITDCSVVFDNRRYIGADEAAVARLHDAAGENVIVAYDPNEPWSAAVLSMGNEFLCWLKPEKLLPHSDEAREEVKRMVSLRRRLRNQTQDDIQQVHQLAASTGALNGLELLERKAVKVLPMAVGDFVTQRKPRIRVDDTAVAPACAADIADRLIELEEN